MATFNLETAKALVELFAADEDTLIDVQQGNHGQSDPGLYAHYTNYPNEGTHHLGAPNAS